MKKIDVPLEANLESCFYTDEITFVHFSNKRLNTLRKQSYDSIAENSSLKYANERKEFEYQYKDLLDLYPERYSFLYASPVSLSNYHSSMNVLLNPEYTYYFKLTLEQLDMCVFHFVEDEENYTQPIKGLKGLTSAVEKWFNSPDVMNSKKIHNINLSERVQVAIPISVKPFAFIPKILDRNFYHCNLEKIDTLKKYSYVSPYKEDAISYTIPWDKEHIFLNREEHDVPNRLGKNLLFKPDIDIEDCPVHLYRVKNTQTISAKNVDGKVYPSHRATTAVARKEEKSLRLIKTITSWKDYFLT